MKASNILYNFILIFSTILVNYCQGQSNEGICAIRGICGDTEFGVIPCSNKSEPQLLKETPENIRSLSLLEAMCPQFHDNGVAICCDEFQLEAMFITVYNLAHMGFNHCPSCLKNLEQMFCEMNCSPKQNQFIKVTKLEISESGHHLANEVDFYLSEVYANAIFDSCKNVRNFEGKIMDQICSGSKGDDCTAKKWLSHMGTRIENEGVSPFKINFHITGEKELKDGNNLFKPLNEKSFKCSEKTNKVMNACDCHHCPEACPQTKRKREVSPHREKRDAGMCLMKGICGETAFGAIPCVANEAPSPISDPIALEELREMCPHLATSDSPSVCCTEEQVIRLNETFEMVSMFLKECPACVRNFEKVICHLSCATDQNNFMKVTKTQSDDDGKDMVSEVEYYVNEEWAKGVYDSCKEVHRLGFNVLDHYCKPFKAVDCDHQKFLQSLGGDHQHLGHSPFEIKFIFSNDESVESDGIQYKPIKLPFYKCSEKPHSGEGICPCIHCQESCAPGEQRVIEKQLPKFKGKRKRQIDYKLNLKKFENYFQSHELCLFDKHCGHNSNQSEICLNIRKPKPLTDEVSVKMLRDICPDLVQTNKPMVCCDSLLVHQMNDALMIVSKMGFSECPSCLHNLKQVIGHFACSPKQNQLIRVLNATNVNNKVVINHLEYFIDQEFGQTLFDSCKSLYGGLVMNMMCGFQNNCTADQWLNFMGLSKRNGGFSPFQMDVKLSPQTNVTINGQMINPLKTKAFSCNQSPNPFSNICGCAHCPESCPS